MSTIAFLGLGHMGGPMAANLVKAGHRVRGFDLSDEALERLAAAGGEGLLEMDVNPNPLRAAFELTGRALAGGAWEIGSLPGLGITDLPGGPEAGGLELGEVLAQPCDPVPTAGAVVVQEPLDRRSRQEPHRPQGVGEASGALDAAHGEQLHGDELGSADRHVVESGQPLRR